MRLQNVFENYPINSQVVLKFSNDNDVLITPEMMDENSKFIRNSKRRLDEEFIFDGIIQGDAMIHGSDDTLANSECDGYMYRTFVKGKCNYFLFIITNEKYRLLENIKRKSYKACKRESDEAILTQARVAPNVEHVVDLYPTHDGTAAGHTYWFSMESPMFRKGCCLISDDIVYDSRNIYVGQYMATIYGLRTVLKNADKISKVRIHADMTKQYGAGVYNLPLGKWRPFNQECSTYARMMNELKEELGKKGVSICFMK